MKTNRLTDIATCGLTADCYQSYLTMNINYSTHDNIIVKGGLLTIIFHGKLVVTSKAVGYFFNHSIIPTKSTMITGRKNINIFMGMPCSGPVRCCCQPWRGLVSHTSALLLLAAPRYAAHLTVTKQHGTGQLRNDVSDHER